MERAPDRLAGLAAGAVPGASWSSVVLGDPTEPTELAADSEEAQRIEDAVRAAVHAGVTTADIGGSHGTRAVGAAIAAHLRA